MATAQQPAMSPSSLPVEQVLDRATGPRRAEAEQLLALCREISGCEPVVWAGRIIGFGQAGYTYDSGHGGIMPLLAFAPSKSQHTIYLVSDYAQKWPNVLTRLGKHKTSKACLYITRLSTIDLSVLRELLELTLAAVRADPHIH